MIQKEKIRHIAELISKNHDGQAMLNFEQASKVIGCGRHTLARDLHDAGITIKKVGPSKRVDVFDLAEFMCQGRVAPIDNM